MSRDERHTSTFVRLHYSKYGDDCSPLTERRSIQVVIDTYSLGRVWATMKRWRSECDDRIWSVVDAACEYFLIYS
jgi:hypothetical protein